MFINKFQSDRLQASWVYFSSQCERKQFTKALLPIASNTGRSPELVNTLSYFLLGPSLIVHLAPSASNTKVCAADGEDDSCSNSIRKEIISH